MEHAQLPSTSSTAPTVEATTSRSALPSCIPQERYAGKMLIVCFDGTGNEFNTDNSNIVQLVSMLKRDDKTKQMVYYQVWLSFFYDPYIDLGHICSLALGRTSHIHQVVGLRLLWLRYPR
jgi:hypothetical protein